MAIRKRSVKNHRNFVKARRRVRMRSALLLTLGVFALTALGRLLLAPALPGGVRTLLEALLTVLAFGGGAYLGLCVLDGDHSSLVPLRRLSRAQTLWVALLGVTAVFPMALIADLMDALRGVAETVPAAIAPANAGLLVKSVLIAPVCEELFFRGYLAPALERDGKLRAAVVTSVCFALVHPAAWTAHLAQGMLLYGVSARTGSLPAAILVHTACNLTLLTLGALGASGLLMGWSLAACIVKVLGCAVFAAVLKRAYTARETEGTFELRAADGFSRRERVWLAAALAALLLAMMLGG